MHNSITKYKCHAILVIIFLITSILSYGQGTDLNYSTKRGFIGFTFQPANTYIVNSGEKYITEDIESKSVVTFNGIVELGFKFTEYFSISSGLGYKSYSTEIALSSYSDSYDSIDSENDPFNMQVSGSNIMESQNIGNLMIPLKIQLQVKLSYRLSAFVNTGVMFLKPVVKSYNGRGDFDYNGYYPEYNVTLYNLPAYGFPEDVSLSINDNLQINNFGYNIFGSVGINYEIGPLLDVALSVQYDQSLKSISQVSSSDFHLSKTSTDYNSLINSTAKADIRALGACISLIRYFE